MTGGATLPDLPIQSRLTNRVAELPMRRDAEKYIVGRMIDMSAKDGVTKVCFVIMPISDVKPYEKGHFWQVYKSIIEPSCQAAGFTPIRADDVKITNYIMIDILRKIIEADMVVCDVSSKNPNVLYELGIRHAFNLPVTLIKDSKTTRVFDIQGLRDIEYDARLTRSNAEEAVKKLTDALKITSNIDKGEVNSIIQLLGLRPAQVPSIGIPRETYYVLNAIKEINERTARLERATNPLSYDVEISPLLNRERVVEVNFYNRSFRVGTRIKHPKHGEGQVTYLSKSTIELYFDDETIEFFYFDLDWDEINALEVQ